MSAMITRTVSVMGVFFGWHWKSSDTISEMFYYTISTNFNCYQTLLLMTILFSVGQQPTPHHACNAVKLQRCKLSTSLLLIMTFSLSAQQWSLLIMRFGDSRLSMSKSCESTILNKSVVIKGWFKSCEVEYSIRVKRCDFVFFCFTR